MRLLDDYVGTLAEVRDSRRQPVGFFRSLFRYPDLGRSMSRTSFDIATVTRELHHRSQTGEPLRGACPPYKPDVRVPHRSAGPGETLGTVVLANVGRRSERLRAASSEVIENLRASADFHQALTNLRLQAGVIFLSVVVVALAVVRVDSTGRRNTS